MKKKVLYGVFMALFAFAAIGTLQSCKDDLSDLKNQTTYDVSNLKSQLETATTNLRKLIQDNQDSLTRHLAWLKANSDAIKDNATAIGENADSIDQVARDLKALEQSLADYAKVEWVKQLMNGENYDDELIQSVIDNGGLIPMITGALGSIEDLQNYCDGLDTEVNNLKTTLGAEDQAGTVLGRLKALELANDTINNRLNELAANDQAVLDAFGVADNDALKTKVQQLLNDIYAEGTGALAKIASLESKVADLEREFNELVAYVKANVSGILIQGTDNPLFGNFSLPIGVKSNMLFNWYGKSEAPESYTFPTAEAGYGVDNNTIAEAALTALNPETVTIGARGSYIGAEEGISLGKVYLTVNPTNVNFDGESFTLETSAGDALPYNLKIKKSNDVLAFGYTTRADEEKAPNGFYEAEVFMPKEEAAIEVTDIKVTQSLESAMTEVVNGGSKKTAALDILKKMYNLMSGELKAYGVRYDWTSTLNGVSMPNAVLSQYDLAVATAQPLGFNFLEGKGTSRKVPTLGNVDNFLNRLQEKVNKKFTFKTKQITVKGKAISLETITVDDVVVDEEIEVTPGVSTNVPTTKVVATIEGLKVGNKTLADIDTDPADPEDIMTEVNAAIRKAILEELGATYDNNAGEWSDKELQAEVNIKVEATLLEMQNQVNDAINSITAKATSTVNSAFNKVRKHSDRLQQLVDLYNKVADKLSEVLANPNNYLQVAAAYKTNDGFGLLSNDPASPTQMTAGSGLHLFLTTYTAELIAPAYKKYVAVTAVNGQANGIAALNTGDVLNKVLDGNQIDAVIPVDAWTAGNVYELTYQAVDYTGHTSTRKFYIQVI